MAFIEFVDIEKRYGTLQAVSGMNLSVEKGEMVALLGPSGCGKTTTLRMLAGFVGVTSGSLLLDGKDITAVPPYQRNLGMVFQGYALFPHMTVAKNVAFGLRMRRLPEKEIASRVMEVLDKVQLRHLAERFPGQLSGGQQQRVALARAMAINPDVLLLDEPLSALDASLRHEVREEIRYLQKSLELTTLIVTHDQDEALSMADRLVIMNKGHIEQIGTPEDVYENPCNPFVAQFLGKSNFLRGHVDTPGTFITVSGDQLRYMSECGESGAGLLSFRPERTRLRAVDAEGERTENEDINALSGELVLSTYLGHLIEHKVRLNGGEMIVSIQANTEGMDLNLGSQVEVTWFAHDTRWLG